MSDQDSRKLVCIGTKERGLLIWQKYPEDQYYYIGIKCRETSNLEPSLVGAMFPDYADSVDWSDIFILAQTDLSVTGVVVIRKDPNKQPIPQSSKKDQAGVRHKDESIVYSYYHLDSNTFKGNIMNVAAAKEYVSSAEVEGSSQEAVTKPTIISTAPIINVPRKPLDNIKPTQSKSANAQANAVIKEPAVKQTIKSEPPKVQFDIRQSEFVPITAESLSHILDRMRLYEEQERVVAIIFDKCFNEPGITMDAIRKRYEDLFGQFEDDCVLIKSNLCPMMPNLEEAYKRKILMKGQAYFIGAKDLTRKRFVSVASSRPVLFGLMTMGCVMLNLKKGAYMLSRNALSPNLVPRPTVIHKHEKVEANKATANNVPNEPGEISRKAIRTARYWESELVAMQQETNQPLPKRWQKKLKEARQVLDKAASMKQKIPQFPAPKQKPPIQVQQPKSSTKKQPAQANQPKSTKKAAVKTVALGKNDKPVPQPITKKEAQTKSKKPPLMPLDFSNVPEGQMFNPDDLDEFIRRSDTVTKTMHKLQPYGNAVIRIDNLPADLTVDKFNLMMGSYSLVGDQIIAARQPNTLMNVRIIMNSDHPDLHRLLSKNKLRTVGNATLFIKRTDLKELETFLTANYNKLVSLEVSKQQIPGQAFPVPGTAVAYANGSK